MNNKVKIGIIICDRYKNCAGGNCFRAMKNREGAFDIYQDRDVKLVGYTTCGGCPGGNLEFAPEEMKKMVQRLFTLQREWWLVIRLVHISTILRIL